MRWTILLALFGLPLSVLAQEPYIEILGVAIQRGMTQEAVRALIPSSAIHEAAKGPDAPEEIEIWFITLGPQQEYVGDIRFESGRVVKARRHLQTSNSLDAYELFVFLHETLRRLTEGADYTCAEIMTYAPQDLFPQSETVLVLPDRVIEIGTASRSGGGSGSVSIRESLRMDPVPSGEKVQAGMGESGHCVFRD